MITTVTLGAGGCGWRRSAASAASVTLKGAGLCRSLQPSRSVSPGCPIFARRFATAVADGRADWTPSRRHRRRPLSSMAAAFHDDEEGGDGVGGHQRRIPMLGCDSSTPTLVDDGSSSTPPLPMDVKVAADDDEDPPGQELRSRGAHCDTCTCHQHDGPGPVLAANVNPIAPASTPAPAPKWSFHKRVLPPNLTALSSPKGKRMFANSLSSGNAESYFPLSEQFLTQSDPAYCGLSTLVMVLNALSIDPNVRWRGGWRWFEEGMLLVGCCIDVDHVRRDGISMEQFAGIGRCNGASIQVRRPGEHRDDVRGWRGTPASPPSRPNSEEEGTVWNEDDLRADIRHHVRNPPPPAGDGSGFLVVSFARSSLHQTGEGHFSPVAAYHAPTDRALILDVARFKYAPYWVSVSDLYDAMLPPDTATGRPRGWFEVRPSSPPVLNDEKRRPGDLVADGFATVAADGGGSAGGGHACPVGDIKVTFCAASPVAAAAANAAGSSKAKSSSDGNGSKKTSSAPPSTPASSPLS